MGLYSIRYPRFPLLIMAILVLVTAALGGHIYSTQARVATAVFRLIDARRQGTFNIGAASSAVTSSSGSMELSYTVPPGTGSGVWTSGFDDVLSPGTADLARIRIRSNELEAMAHLAVVLELKGTEGVQRIPLELRAGWNTLERPLDWRQIGLLKEIVLSVGRIGDGSAVSGTLSFDITLHTMPLLRKLSLRPSARMAAVLLLGLAAAGLMAIFGRPRRALQPSGRAISSGLDGSGGAQGIKRDFVLGTAMVLPAILALGIYHLGGREPLEAGWSALVFAAAGGLLGGWMKYGLTGKHLTPGEAFQNIAVSGLLAASSSSRVFLQPLQAWSDLLLLSGLVSAAAVFLYHLINLYRLATSGRHSGAATAVLTAGAPYLIGLLLLLEPAGLATGWPAAARTLGGLLVVWAFNEAVAGVLALATRRARAPGTRAPESRMPSWQAHAGLLAAAAAVTAAPWIAGLGSGTLVSSLPAVGQWPVVVLAAILSQAALWAEVYLVTGLILDALNGRSPSADPAGHPFTGLKKGLVFGGVFMGLLFGLGLLVRAPAVAALAAARPLAAGMLIGAAAFPLAKTLIETFDGTQSFFRRLANSYRNPAFFLRGALIGLGSGYAFSQAMTLLATGQRAAFGAAVGLAASAGVSLLRDGLRQSLRRGQVQTWRVYLVQAVWGGLIGAGLGFYFDAAQVSVVLDKFRQYVGIGQAPRPYEAYLLLSKWGHLQLGAVTGGVKLLFNESLVGVLSWAIPAWLFAINATFMSAALRRDRAPIAALFTRQGLLQLGRNTIQVFRWGLWMAPIIFTFLRPMATPTWYNQDGAVRTLLAAFHSLTSNSQAFNTWSLGVFVSILAYDAIRILIWLDHMGLRVATLVNLSFLGMDRLDRRLARFLGPAATAQCIPEGIKRFATWAPLLIPFYLPRGADWDFVWNRSQSLQAAAAARPGGLLALPPGLQILLAGAAIVAAAVLAGAIRRRGERLASRRPAEWRLANSHYETVLRENGEMFSRLTATGCDVSRRSYDRLDPAGRALFLVDPDREAGDPERAWALLGHFPRRRSEPAGVEHRDGVLRIATTRNGIRAAVEIRLAGDDPAELWTVRVENRSDRPRRLKAAPYLEWVLHRPEADRGHTQYNRLYPEMEYAGGLHAVLAWHKQSKVMGVLAADAEPEGFLTSRVDFIGRARSIASPRALETLDFCGTGDTGAHPTFDPIGSLLVGLELGPGESTRMRFLIGAAGGKREAIELITRHLAIPGSQTVSPLRRRESAHAVGHGEIPPGTPLPYAEYSADGRTLRIRTPLTPRPWDHTLSNARGHVMVVTNRGLHTSSNGNSQQNRLTPDWPDLVTREAPGEAFYLYDADMGRWYSPTYHPLNDPRARYETEFGVDGTATFRMTRDTLATELTAFVPPDDPAGLYLLTVRNLEDRPRRVRVAPYFQMVLADQPEHAGPLSIRRDRDGQVLYFENPRNDFRAGPAFVAMSAEVECLTTRRDGFFGPEPDVTRPAMVEAGAPGGSPDGVPGGDDRPVAAFLATLEIPPRGEATVSVVLGQADNRGQAAAIARKYRDLQSVRETLAATRAWWLDRIGQGPQEGVVDGRTVTGRYLDWLKYQTLAERIWARRGFYQASGAYGFRDQLQDAVNLIWMDPLLARRQIVLHAAQQFLEGDVVHWFHLLWDGRTGFAARTHASDNLLWLAWATVEYVGMTGDTSILDERAPYLEAEQPLPPLPAGKHGLGFVPLRSSRGDSIYRHCLRAIDRVLERRLGAHGLPLIGTGDWNDGLDEIGSEGRGESVWLGFFLHSILRRMLPIIEGQEGQDRAGTYADRVRRLESALQGTWRQDRYLRAIHDDGTEIGVRGSGVWEIDALTAAWAVMSGIDPERGRIMFDTAIAILEKGNTILLGWPALREDTTPYLGRSSRYPEGVRENGMYCHGVQWLVGAARVLARQCRTRGDLDGARRYAATAWRLWYKISAPAHVEPGEIETYGGQPNKQAADLVTALDPGRMGWSGYTGAAGWMFRQYLEGVLGLRLEGNRLIAPAQEEPAGPPAPADILYTSNS